jgi:hypothetical protein
VSEKRVLRRIFGPKREEVVGGWRRLHNEELHSLYASANIIRVIKLRMRWAGYVACKQNSSGNIGMDLREWGWAGVNWMHLDEDRNQWQW